MIKSIYTNTSRWQDRHTKRETGCIQLNLLKKRILQTIFIFLMCSMPSAVIAGAWIPKPANGYAKIWLKWLPGLDYLDGQGNLIPYGQYHELFLNGYVEVGLLPSLGAWIHFPMLRNFWLEDHPSGSMKHHITIGDPAIGLRWGLVEKQRIRISVELGGRMPLASGEPVQKIFNKNSPNKQIGNLRIGRGVWELQGSILLGYTWDWIYIGMSVGYIFMSNQFDGVINWTTETGFQLRKLWHMRIRITGWHPLGNGNAAYHDTVSGLGNGTGYAGFSLEVDYNFLPKWFVGVCIEGGLFRVRRQTTGPVISPYVAFQF